MCQARVLAHLFHSETCEDTLLLWLFSEGKTEGLKGKTVAQSHEISKSQRPYSNLGSWIYSPPSQPQALLLPAVLFKGLDCPVGTLGLQCLEVPSTLLEQIR